jgi:5-methylcytosine-specific restriction endonuclease McrA
MARAVRERAQECCEYCLLPQSSQEAAFHIDHILPRVVGGATVEDNLALACVSCSLRKGARTHSMDSDIPVRIFDPRE